MTILLAKTMNLSLVQCFTQIADPRRASGLRHPLVPFLSMSTMAMMSGYTGFREIGTFMKANQVCFTEMFALKHGVPGFVQIRTIFSMLDFEQVNKAFQNWARQFMPQQSGQWVSGDGKALSSTVTHPHDCKQEFVMMVSLFTQQSGLVLMSSSKANQKGGEIPALNQLLEQLQARGMIITLDALHCKKNSGSNP